MDEAEVARLLAFQCGVISRRQVLAAGGGDDAIERLLRCRVWARLLPGVYVDHTGPPSWRQQAWGAVLFAAPAALSGASALRAEGVRGYQASDRIEIAIAEARRVRLPDAFAITRLSDFDRVARCHLAPPRLSVERAVLQVASRASRDDSAVAALADACQSRVTIVVRLRDELEQLPRLPRRRFLFEVLADVDEGALSPMERRYLRDVERRHGLPRARRQQGGGVARDVEYVDQGVAVELDGRLGHEWTSDRWADLDRDFDAVVGGLLTVRVGWRQVLDPCRLAHRIGAILHARGWRGCPRSCGAECIVGVLPAPGADRFP